MTLNEYVTKQVRETKLPRREVLKALAEKSKVSLMTLLSVDRGMRMGNFGKMSAISEATGQSVSVKDLAGHE